MVPLKHKQHSSFRGFRAVRGSSRASYLPQKTLKARTKKFTNVGSGSKLTYYSKQRFAFALRGSSQAQKHSSFRGFRAVRGSSRASYLPQKTLKARTKKFTNVGSGSKLTYYSKQRFAFALRGSSQAQTTFFFSWFSCRSWFLSRILSTQKTLKARTKKFTNVGSGSKLTYYSKQRFAFALRGSSQAQTTFFFSWFSCLSWFLPRIRFCLLFVDFVGFVVAFPAFHLPRCGLRLLSVKVGCIGCDDSTNREHGFVAASLRCYPKVD